ncbi:ATP-dependent helicase [Gorillibacterium timonense]|uniref:ATP-dependent helicase n=1 Tax=Gorillibacterium timonense TaxID=1689269 RepID=UPI00071C4C7E
MKESDFFIRLRESGITLNEVQKQAVLHTEGPLLLLAAPGSGKTTTIISRIGYLLEGKQINPKRIKALSFSRASARDMKERFEHVFPELPTVDFSTIHSLAFQVMKRDFHKRGLDFRVIEGDRDSEEKDAAEAGQPPLSKRFLLRNLYRSLTGENLTEDQMEELATTISCIKNKKLPRERWTSVHTDVPQAAKAMEVYEAYKLSGPDGRLVDYEDMLTLAEQALERDPSLLRTYQEKFDYILTDESQDTSLVQHAIIEKLARRHGNLCVVADDDQSIYGWRGAEPDYLLDFRKVYPNAAVLYMEQNYRSSQEIVHAANEFIKRNKNRYAKNMMTQNPSQEPVLFRRFSDHGKQVSYLVQEIRKVENLAEVAVLYRNNSSSIALMNRFDRAGIPFFMKDSDNRFFSHWVVEDVLNFMRMTFTEKRPELLEKIHSKMNGYISKPQMAALKELGVGESVFDDLLAHGLLQDYQIKPVAEIRDTFRRMRGMPPLQAIRVIRNSLGYEKALDKLSARLGFNCEYLLGILNALEEIAEPLETMEQFAERLAYLKTVLQKARPKKGQAAVTFSTFHSAKGLEFERVYLIDLVEGTIPSEHDRTPGQMEEAVRLFYVGMTRAKRRLELLSYRKKDKQDLQESRFMAAVRRIVNPEEAEDRQARPSPGGAAARGRQAGSSRTKGSTEGASSLASVRSKYDDPEYIGSIPFLKVGAAVKHALIGRGVILRLEGDEIEIRFDSGDRRFSVGTCLRMELLDAAT